MYVHTYVCMFETVCVCVCVLCVCVVCVCVVCVCVCVGISYRRDAYSSGLKEQKL